MRIAVDGRHLAAGRGVARYSRRLLDAMQELGGDWRVVPGSRAAFAAAALTGRPRLDRTAGGAEVVWAPAPAPLAVSSDVPFVLTIHDLSWIDRPQDFTPYERLWHRAARIPALARRADRVITDSHAVAGQVVDVLGVPAERIAVIPLGPGLAGVPHAGLDGRGNRPSPPYFLVVGALEPRKAPDVLARAHARATAQGLEAELVFAGEGRLADRLPGPGIRVLAGQTDEDLRALYAGALAVVHPAHLEGFGFPPIEGLAHGVPAIVADLPVYAETLGDGALRVRPGDEEALAAAMLRVEHDPGLRERLVRAGQTAIAPLSWERAARETHAVLAEAAGR